MNPEASAVLDRALQLSRAVAAAADRGDLETMVRLDTERRRLLEAARSGLSTFAAADRDVLAEIQALNARALGSVQHRQRATARNLDMVAVGCRAVRAYAATR
jgi:hypothetical protein